MGNREKFAAAALQGILAANSEIPLDIAVKESIKAADLMVEMLDESKGVRVTKRPRIQGEQHENKLGGIKKFLTGYDVGFDVNDDTRLASIMINFVKHMGWNENVLSADMNKNADLISLNFGDFGKYIGRTYSKRNGYVSRPAQAYNR